MYCLLFSYSLFLYFLKVKWISKNLYLYVKGGMGQKNSDACLRLMWSFFRATTWSLFDILYVPDVDLNLKHPGVQDNAKGSRTRVSLKVKPIVKKNMWPYGRSMKCSFTIHQWPKLYGFYVSSLHANVVSLKPLEQAEKYIWLLYFSIACGDN